MGGGNSNSLIYALTQQNLKVGIRIPKPASYTATCRSTLVHSQRPNLAQFLKTSGRQNRRTLSVDYQPVGGWLWEGQQAFFCEQRKGDKTATTFQVFTAVKIHKLWRRVRWYVGIDVSEGHNVSTFKAQTVTLKIDAWSSETSVRLQSEFFTSSPLGGPETDHIPV